MAEIKKETHIRRKPNQVFSEVDGQVVMLNIKKEVYYSLNDVGTAIWNELSEKRSFEDLMQRLQELFDVSESECRKDVEPFLSELLNAGVIEFTDE